MSESDSVKNQQVGGVAASDGAQLLRALMDEAMKPRQATTTGLLIGSLLALVDDGHTPLIVYAGQPSDGAMRARSVVQLDGRHVGQNVVLGLELQDPARPIVLGVVQGQPGWPAEATPGQVTLDADGQRMVVSAHRELLLRCGKATISLRFDGRIEIRGESILTHATAVNRIRGGSVELN